MEAAPAFFETGKRGGVPFCPVCGTILMLPEVNIILCGRCQHRSSYEALGAVEVVTQSPAKPPQPWLEAPAETGRDEGITRATVEEDCPKCGFNQLSFYTMQLRSADEGQTVFYECLKCAYVHLYSHDRSHKFSVNN